MVQCSASRCRCLPTVAPPLSRASGGRSDKWPFWVGMGRRGESRFYGIPRSGLLA